MTGLSMVTTSVHSFPSNMIIDTAARLCSVEMSIRLLPKEVLAEILVSSVKRWSAYRGHDWTTDGVTFQGYDNVISQDVRNYSMVNRMLHPSV